MVPNAAVAFGLFCGVESFVVAPLPAGQQQHCTAVASCASSFSSQTIGGSTTSTATARTSSRVMMMGGFGDPVKKKKKPTGVGRGQEAYQRQMKSFKGLVGAGAEGVDVYVHREVSVPAG